MKQRSQNRLAREKSPYLLQHADNPVDWYPWGDAAFNRAKQENKPVFLSIGYATCHWCHVMAHESFEDETVADLLNETFICVKVDREERPDIDGVYMTVCQMLTGSGGWPLTIVMTPDKEPFFAATYIPRENRYGHTGLVELVRRIRQVWDEHPEEVRQSTGKIMDALKQQESHVPGERLDATLLDTAFSELLSRYDSRHGGFGEAPKFPMPHTLLFLLRYYKRTGNPQALTMVEHTLEAMQRGGIFDHIGFGFHRYSTDAEWLVPHFEKMLYDQALLIMAYTEAWQVTRREDFAATVHRTIEYVLRDLTSPEGAFFSAEDADSEGEEGRFYLWTEAEVRDVLTGDEAELVRRYYSLQPEGNYRDEATGGRTGRNMLHIKQKPEELTAATGMLPDEILPQLDSIRRKLFERRTTRVRPLRDDKVLTDWNGLMIAALAKAGTVFERHDYIAAAVRAVDFIMDNLADGNNRLQHRFRDGESGITGILDDYAFLSFGLLELYHATYDSRYLAQALDFTGSTLHYFRDDEHGGFFTTPHDGEALLFRQKEAYDSAVPSGNSINAWNLLRLARITAREDLENAAHETGQGLFWQIGRMPSAFTQMMIALDYAVSPSSIVILAGERSGSDTREMLRSLRNLYVPNTVILLLQDNDRTLREIAPYLSSYSQQHGKATAFVCIDYTCSLPVTDPDEMLRLLAAPHDGPLSADS